MSVIIPGIGSASEQTPTNRLNSAIGAIAGRVRAPTDPIFTTNLELVSLELNFGYNVEDKDDATITSGFFTVSPTIFPNVEAFSSTDPVTVFFLKYGFEYKASSFVLTNVTTLLFLAQDTNSNTTLSEAAAAALTGITVDKVGKTVTVSQSRTQSELYDYLQWYQSQAANVDLLPDGEIFSTVQGNVFNLLSGWELIFTAAPSGDWTVSGDITIGAVFNLNDFTLGGTVFFDVGGSFTFTDCQIDSVDTVDGNETVSLTPAGTSNTPINLDPTNITINTPPLTFTIDSSEAGSLIQLFETGTQTLLASTTGTSLDYVYTVAEDVDYVVQKAGFLPQRFTGITLSDSSVTVELQTDPVYDAANGLTYTTDFSYNRTTKELTLVTRQEGRDFYSALIDAFIAQASLRNTAFDFQAVGPDSIFFLNDAEIVSGQEDNWKGAGIRYVTTAGATAAEWVSVKSSGTIPAGGQGRYQQQAGLNTTDLRATGAVDQIIQTFGDVTHGNFDYRDHLVIKYQINGYREARADVVALAGSNLEPFEYSVALQPVAIAAPTGDPGITITVTDEGATPVTWNGKDFSITVLYTGAESGEDILRELNYNLSLDTTYQGKDPFNWPEMVLEAGSAYETLRGITEGGVGATLKGVRVVNGLDEPHPDFTRFQADDGTYYVPPVSNTASTSGLVPNSRLQVFNVTTDTEIVNAVQASDWALNYTEGNEFTNGDEVRIRATFYSATGPNYKLPLETTVVAGPTGFTALISQAEWVPVNNIGIDGALVNEFTLDGTSVQIDINDPDGQSQKQRIVAWYAYELWSNPTAIDLFFGALFIEDEANYQVKTAIADLTLENVGTQNVLFTDIDTRLYRDDGQTILAATGTASIEIQSDKIYVATTGGSGGDATEAKQDQILSELGEIQGAGFDTNNNSLVNITDDIASVDANVDSVKADTGLTKKVLENKSETNPATGKQTIYDDDGITPLLEANLYDDADGSIPWNGTNPINRRDKLE